MRILLTTDTVGGVWTFTQSLSKGLLERRNQVELVSFGRSPLEPQQQWVDEMRAEWEEDFLFESSEAPLEWMTRNADTFADGASVLARVAARFKPEVVHSSQFCWGALDLGVPTVITAHSDVLSWAEACQPDGLESSDWLSTYVHLVRRGLEEAEAVVAPTQWMLDALRRHFAVPGWTAVVANGTEVPLWPPLEPERRQMRAICVGRRWDEGKGMALLTDGAWPIPIVVAGEDRFENAQGAHLGAVESLGLLSRSDLSQAMHGSAIFLCTSVYEPFGLAAVEAALWGCAIVCRDIAPLREVWGEDALYFSDAPTLRAVLQLLACNEVLLASMQKAARSRARRYDVSLMTDSYLEIYGQQRERAHA